MYLIHLIKNITMSLQQLIRNTWKSTPRRAIGHARGLWTADDKYDKLPALSPTYTVNDMEKKRSLMELKWGDGHKSLFHYVWLRDNCQCPKCRHPKAEERVVDTNSIPLSIVPEKVEVLSPVEGREEEGGAVKVKWAHEDGESHTSTFTWQFLRNHCYSSDNSHSKRMHSDKILWKAQDIENSIPKISYRDVMESEAGLQEWLDAIQTHGLALIVNSPSKKAGASEHVARRISFVKETFWGDTWSVKNEPNPLNLSLTGAELFPHTDFSWSPTPPGLQFLHCLEFSGGHPSEGLSTFVDGFRVAQDLRRLHPDVFRLLTEVPISHGFSSEKQQYVCREPTIRLDKRGHVGSIRFNQANRKPLDVAPELVLPTYDALQRFSDLCRSQEYLMRFQLQEGEIVTFNNHRLLHGRTAYDSSNTIRHLHGCYLDLEQFESRYSIISNNRKAKKFNYVGNSRMFSTSRVLDPGYDTYDDVFVRKALEEHQDLLDSKEAYDDKSVLNDVVNAGSVSFTQMKDGTKADYVYQCALFQHDIETNLVPRIIGMLEKLQGDHIKVGTGAQVDLFQHSIQCATRAKLDGADDEMVAVALLHDIGEMMSPLNHGDIAGAIMRPYICDEAYWILAHHEVFQGYYYFDQCGGNRDTRDIYKDHKYYQATADFCEKYDQSSFDPAYESYPIEYFIPYLKKTFSRKPYWFQPDHPKLGVVTVQDRVSGVANGNNQ